MQHATLEDAGIPPHSVDLVTLWEVLEHLPDPLATLRRISVILRPGGLLALSTPDAGSAVARALGGRWPGWSKIPEHLFFFDRATLRRLPTEAGFEIETMRYVGSGGEPGLSARPHRIARGSPTAPAFLRALAAATGAGVNPLYDLMITARLRR